jgi:hypothetical protein
LCNSGFLFKKADRIHEIVDGIEKNVNYKRGLIKSLSRDRLDWKKVILFVEVFGF